MHVTEPDVMMVWRRFYWLITLNW